MGKRQISIKWKVWFWTLGAVLGVWIFFAFGMPVLWPILLGYALACIVRPMVYWLETHWHIKRQIAIVVLLFLLLSILITAVVWLVGTTVRQLLVLLDHTDQMLAMLSEMGNGICDWVSRWFPVSPEQCRQWLDNAVGQLGKQSGDVGQITGHAARIVNIVGSLIVDGVLAWITAYFFARDNEKIGEWRKRFLYRDEVNLICHQLKVALVAYCKSQLTLWGLISVTCVIGLWLLGNPYCLLLGLGIGILDAIPFVGTGVVFVPWAIFSFIQGNLYQGIGLTVLFLITYFIRELLEPRLMGNGMGISSFASLLAIYIGFQVFGLFGIFYGPVAYVLIVTIVKEACNLPRL